MRIAFDVDGTLRDYQYEQRTPLVALAALLLKLPDEVEVIVWSGGGKGYAEQAVRDLGLDGAIALAKPFRHEDVEALGVDIAFDDESRAELAPIMAVVREV